MKTTKTLVSALAATALCVAFATSAQAGQKFGADRHVAAGVQCTTCHGKNMKEPEEPTIETCSGCHNIEKLVAKTSKVKPTNPHTSPHYQDQLDCTNCHRMHEEPVNFCAQCHSFQFNVK